MAGVLLDTHVFIWVAKGTDDLSRAAKQTLSLRSTVPYVSVVSLWEIADAHLAELLRLPHPGLAHGDPFDRLLAAQARAEILSADAKLDGHGVRRIW